MGVGMGEHHKAWKCDDGDHSAIVYAPTRGQARQRGAGSLDAEFLDVSARRAPEFDDLAPAGPSDAQLFQSGWWFECNCGRMAFQADGGEIINGEIVCETCVEATRATQHQGEEP